MKIRGHTLLELSLIFVIIGISFYAVDATISEFQNNTNKTKITTQEKIWTEVLSHIQSEYMYYEDPLSETDNPNIYGVITDDGVLISKNQTAGTVSITLTAMGECGSQENIKVIETLSRSFYDNEIEINNPWNNPWCIQAGALRSIEIDGITINNRALLAYSSGLDSVFNNTISVGAWDECPDIPPDNDSAFICDNGTDAAKTAINYTQDKIIEMVAHLQEYADGEANGDNASEYVNYFINTREIAGGCSNNNVYRGHEGGFEPTLIGGAYNCDTSICETNDGLTNMDYDNGRMISAIGLREEQYTDAWGIPLKFDNSSCNIRNPYFTGEKSTPPFTARVAAQIPGGQYYIRTAVYVKSFDNI